MTSSPSTGPNDGRRTRYALVGTGSRAEMYLDAIATAHADVAELVALADVNPGRLAHYQARATATGSAPVPGYHPDDLESMIGERSVDRIIVTTPDHTHADLIVRALDAGTDVVVEKPITIDDAGCRRISEAVDRTGRSVVVTFNYRYSPRNSALKQLIQDGVVGRVTSVDFEWTLDTSHGADYFRRWHREKRNSGGLLVHKSSHHFDLVNWWIDGTPAKVYAAGGLRFYGGADEGVAEHYRLERSAGNDPFGLDLAADPRLDALYGAPSAHDGYRRDLDVFAPGITIEDNLAVIVEYSDGVPLTYSLNAHSPFEGYRVVVNGTLGRVELEVIERSAVLTDTDGGTVVDPTAHPELSAPDPLRPGGARLILQRHWERAEEIAIPEGTGGHGGGDEILLSDVFRGPGADPLGRPSDSLDGFRAIAVGILGNRSLRSGDAVRVSDVDFGVSLDRGLSARQDA
ncbi:Gfo/Idh/MocA family oxidoreductase [Plantibacter sp. ME-Dv--P-122b]|uniref:Gfo/Idh/MocA family protein n=1 Tax=Plantibacter sp. ME-Dv--P-122b TaxID=3040300 RepID=UPI00254E6462|nr:Gfo/Idh/MocA family oxidoreductase [Plantibacter sp. ME-Dv--P-122b]